MSIRGKECDGPIPGNFLFQKSAVPFSSKKTLRKDALKSIQIKSVDVSDRYIQAVSGDKKNKRAMMPSKIQNSVHDPAEKNRHTRTG